MLSNVKVVSRVSLILISLKFKMPGILIKFDISTFLGTIWGPSSKAVFHFRPNPISSLYRYPSFSIVIVKQSLAIVFVWLFFDF